MDLGITHEHSEAAKTVTVSLGLATLVPRKGQSERELIQAADEALYASKRAGRNRLTISKGAK
jgi:two-component system chemotaxis family response regulator WspR